MISELKRKCRRLDDSAKERTINWLRDAGSQKERSKREFTIRRDYGERNLKDILETEKMHNLWVYCHENVGCGKKVKSKEKYFGYWKCQICGGRISDNRKEPKM